MRRGINPLSQNLPQKEVIGENIVSQTEVILALLRPIYWKCDLINIL